MGWWRRLQETGRAARWRHRFPEPVDYLVCWSCGGVTPHGPPLEMVQATFDLTGPVGIGEVLRTPPESTCWRCGACQPRAIGDQVLPDGAAGVEVACAARGRLGRRCGYHHRIPAAALLATCPRCLTSTPGPATDPGR